MSGVPGRSLRCSRYLYPMLCASRRTTISGQVFVLATDRMIALRRSSLSVIRVGEFFESLACEELKPLSLNLERSANTAAHPSFTDDSSQIRYRPRPSGETYVGMLLLLS